MTIKELGTKILNGVLALFGKSSKPADPYKEALQLMSQISDLVGRLSAALSRIADAKASSDSALATANSSLAAAEAQVADLQQQLSDAETQLANLLQPVVDQAEAISPAPSGTAASPPDSSGSGSADQLP